MMGYSLRSSFGGIPGAGSDGTYVRVLNLSNNTVIGTHLVGNENLGFLHVDSANNSYFVTVTSFSNRIEYNAMQRFPISRFINNTGDFPFASNSFLVGTNSNLASMPVIFGVSPAGVIYFTQVNNAQSNIGVIYRSSDLISRVPLSWVAPTWVQSIKVKDENTLIVTTYSYITYTVTLGAFTPANSVPSFTYTAADGASKARINLTTSITNSASAFSLRYILRNTPSPWYPSSAPVAAAGANPAIPATLSTELSFVINHNDKFAIQMWGATTTATSWGGSMLLEKAPMVQGGGRIVPVPAIPKLHKRSSIKVRRSSDPEIKKPNTKKAERPAYIVQTEPKPKAHKRTSAKQAKTNTNTNTKKQDRKKN